MNTGPANANSDATEPGIDDREISLDELLGWLEFGGWTTLALAPMLYYVNGPAVSPDQFVVRSILVALAAVAAVSIRGYRILRSRRNPVERENTPK